jgi:hypothetical protein
MKYKTTETNDIEITGKDALKLVVPVMTKKHVDNIKQHLDYFKEEVSADDELVFTLMLNLLVNIAGNVMRKSTDDYDNLQKLYEKFVKAFAKWVKDSNEQDSKED